LNYGRFSSDCVSLAQTMAECPAEWTPTTALRTDLRRFVSLLLETIVSHSAHDDASIPEAVPWFVSVIARRWG
jgi:hypothetical protein